LETRLSRELQADGRLPVTLLKAAHHGYAMSNSMHFVKACGAKLCVVTNWIYKIYPNVRWNYVMEAHTPLYSSVSSHGLIATLLPEGGITLSGGNMPREATPSLPAGGEIG